MDWQVTVYPMLEDVKTVNINGFDYLQQEFITDAVDGDPFSIFALAEVGTQQAQILQETQVKVQARAAKQMATRLKLSLTHITLGMNSEIHPHASQEKGGQLSEGVLHRKNEVWGLLSALDSDRNTAVTNRVSGVAKLLRNNYGDQVEKLKLADLAISPWKPSMDDGVMLSVLAETESAKAELAHPNAPEGWYSLAGMLIRESKDAVLEPGSEFRPWDRVALRASSIHPMQLQDERSAKSAADAALKQSQVSINLDGMDDDDLEPGSAPGQNMFAHLYGTNCKRSLPLQVA